MIVVDASAILAICLEEPRSSWVEEQLGANTGTLLISTVNLAEILIRVYDLRPALMGKLDAYLLDGPFRFVPPDESQARAAALARGRFPLNFGDCFTYALSVAEDCPILTLDQDFRDVGRPVLLPP